MLVLPNAAFSQSEPTARERFARGLALVQRDDLYLAAAEFEEAYRQHPHYAVLYNLGQVYSALGKPVEALRAFEAYLEGGGTKISVARRSEVGSLIESMSKRIGYVSFDLDPAVGELLIDGRPIDILRLDRPIPLAAGIHGVTATAPTRKAFVGSIEVVSKGTLTLPIRLAPEVPAQPPTPLGQVVIDSLVPAIRIVVDGVVVDGMQREPQLIAFGPHQIVCQREGYRALQRSIEVSTRGVSHVACDLEPLESLSASESGFLTFSIDPESARLSIDGRRASRTVRVPTGPHAILIQRDGYLDWTKTVTARAGFPVTIEVHLRPTPEHAALQSSAAASRRNWAYVIGGAGLSLLGASAYVYLDNAARYRRWEDERATLGQDIASGKFDLNLSARAGALQIRAASIQQRDDLALGSALIGGALVAYTAVTLLSAPSRAGE